MKSMENTVCKRKNSKPLIRKSRRTQKKNDMWRKRFQDTVSDIALNPTVQEMKQYNHHSHTNCYEHSLHVSFYNYVICSKLGMDARSAAKAGLLHDMFLYDWHGRKRPAGERGHGFEHPAKALVNARSEFELTKKEGDMILKHMFPLTLTPPKYKESCVIIMTDKFCSICEVMDRFFKKEKRQTFARGYAREER